MRSLQDDGIYTSDEGDVLEEGVQEPTFDPLLASETEGDLEGGKAEPEEEENAF
ncbi:MAG: hypothetical protein WCW78_01410 [Candidatus Paceibacterota bacterium]|jgi:hypothetical protein